MSKKSLLFLLVLALAGGGYYYYHTQIRCSFLYQKKVEVGGSEHRVRSRAAIEKSGMSFRALPDWRNAAILYCKASNDIVKPRGRPDELFSYVAANEWVDDPEFVSWFDGNAEVLKLIHKAARKPDAEFPLLGEDDEPVYEMLLPHLSHMRAFARLLSSEGKRFESQRKYGRALESYFAITALADHVRDSNAMLISDLVSIACRSIRNRAVERCMANRPLSEERLRRIIEHYEKLVESPPSFTDCLTREKLCEDSAVDEAMRNPGEAASVLGMLGAPPGESPSSSRRNGEALARAITTMGAEAKAAYERDYAALMKWSELPAWQALRPENDWARYIEGLPNTCIFSKMLLKALSPAKKHYARAEAEEGLVLITAAIKLYEKKNGRPPASLNDLERGYLSKLPTDPFSGRSFIYSVRGTDWILYSVWENLTDDGGAGSVPHKYKEDKDFLFSSGKIPVSPPPS